MKCPICKNRSLNHFGQKYRREINTTEHLYACHECNLQYITREYPIFIKQWKNGEVILEKDYLVKENEED